ncbi:MAG TPA: branched-chain amino acid ABC transporter permease, partial [Candidatus Ventricola gallistercoris]|nr:branched-chain amino acid ABC transporter permease [Candidatus Ventricola gallistercoris]
LLPLRAVSALSVALYGMFLAVIVPSARRSKVVAALILISFALSFVSGHAPVLASLSDGTRTIVLTVAISAAAALIFPVNLENPEASHDA